MLKIIVEGKRIDIADNTTISFTFENPMLRDDRIPAPYSLSFELPLTPRNRKVFDYPDRSTSTQAFTSRKAEVSFSGIVMATGMINIESVAETISVNFSAAVFPDNIRDYLYDQNLFTLDLGTAKNASGQYDNTKVLSEYNAYLIIQLSSTSENGPIAPVISIKGADQSGMIHNYINMYHPTSGYIIDTSYRADGRKMIILPSFRVGWILNRILPHQIENDFFNSPYGDWGKLCLVSKWHPLYNLETTSSIYDIDRDTLRCSVNMADFMPQISANDFINEILKLPCATMYIRGENYIFELNKDILSRNVQHNWSSKVIDSPKLSLQEGYLYECGYNNNKGSVPPDRALIQVDTINDMYEDAVYGDYIEASQPRTYQVATTSQIIEALADTESDNRCRYNVLCQDMGEIQRNDTSDKSSYDNTFNGSVVENNLRRLFGNDISKTRKFYYVPEISPVEDKRPESITVGMWHGMTPSITHSSVVSPSDYPYLSHTNYDAHGNRLGNLSLLFSGQDGLMEKYHKEFKAWVEKDKHILEASVQLDAVDIHRLDMRDKYHVDGVDYFIDTLNVTIAPDKIEVASVKFIEV